MHVSPKASWMHSVAEATDLRKYGPCVAAAANQLAVLELAVPFPYHSIPRAPNLCWHAAFDTSHQARTLRTLGKDAAP